MSDLLPPNIKRCSQCGEKLPAEGTNGLCPACLMAEAMKPSGPKKAWEPPSAEDLAKLLPQYEITRMLGRGGMGAVYQGTQKSLDRTVAIKILSHDLESGDASFAERFKNEARAMAKLTHPGIVAVYDSGETADGLLYIVMEFIEGTDVARMMAKDKRLHSEHAMAITAHVCDALAYAHDRGIIHRDIKPANIMVGYDGVVKVADFGLAKISQEGKTGLTQSGMAMGTLYYMAPEALTLGTGVDQRADIYAVGVMLYQMLTGKLPQGLFELPSLQVPGLDPRYDGIISKALREDRNLRYPRTQDMRHDLDAILTQPVVKVEAAAEKAPAALDTQARPQRPAGQPYRPPQRQEPVYVEKKSSPLPWVAVILVIGLAAWFLFGRSRPAPSSVPVVETSAPKAEPKADESSTVKAPATSAPATIATPTTPAPTTTPASKPVAPPPASTVALNAATKDKPFVNSLGMKFVPVPITGGPSSGKLVLFSVWETRVQDYQDFAEEKKREWPKPPYEEGPTHPAVNVTWDDAQAFCAWLNERESKAGWLKPDEHYRLPSDHEWSCAVGIGEQEDATKMPKDKDMGITNVYPWGAGYPPPTGAGNYNGEEAISRNFSTQQKILAGYRDNFPAMAPVGSFRANHLGLFDLGGNAWEWCEDLFTNVEQARVLRGATFMNRSDHDLNSSFRIRDLPSIRAKDKTVRIVLASAKNTQDVATAKKASNFPPELTALDQQFIKLQAERVTAVFDADVAKLNTGYVGGLDREMAKEKTAGHLDRVAALEAEKNLIAAKQPVPATDDSGVSVALKNLRSIYRDAFAKLESARMANLKALTDPLAIRLKTLEADLTQQNRAADAKAVREYREGLPAQSAPPPPASAVAYSATNPFINSLGMKFVPVPGTEILMCIHETRKADYVAWAAESSLAGGAWRDVNKDGVPISTGDDHPVVNVKWDATNNFCAWLSKKEGKTYRLPTDREWSMAVGTGSDEKWTSSTTPEAMGQVRIDEYPWGKQWPPPRGVANLGDTATRNELPAYGGATDYTDGFATTAPVMSFKPNKLGIFDLPGNASEWVEDWYNASQQGHTIRGSSWKSSRQSSLSAHRMTMSTGLYDNSIGFRCVLEIRGTQIENDPAAKPVTVVPSSVNTVAVSSSTFTNTLGMKFVPVPGTKVQMCLHETRKGDYANFAAAVPSLNASWKNVRIQDGLTVSATDDHPVVNVSWEEAAAFCAWLSQKEGKTYRLPTDREWSIAVGLGTKESQIGTPESRNENLKDLYPWGTQWPPPASAGNYADTTLAARSPSQKAIPGFADGHATTAPVMSFPSNALGIYDLGGNVWELCSDVYSTSSKVHVLRGGSWGDSEQHWLLSSSRDPFEQTGRYYIVGFRVVLETPNMAASVPPPPAPVSVASVTPVPAKAVRSLKPDRIKYQNKAGTVEDRYSWKGRHMAVLTESGSLDAAVMTTLVEQYDQVYEYYRDVTGREPRKPADCGQLAVTAEDDTSVTNWSVGSVGMAKMWIKAGSFQALYKSMAESGEHPVMWFREFGLNTWYYAPQLSPAGGPGYIDAFPSGYCIVMRTMAARRLNLKVAPPRSTEKDWDKALADLLGLYLADASLNFANTLATGTAPANPGDLGAAELFAAFCLRLCADYGGDAFHAKLWQEVGKSQPAKTAQDGIDNFTLAACAAADKDLSGQFTSQWRWPMSASAMAKASKRWNKP